MSFKVIETMIQGQSGIASMYHVESVTSNTSTLNKFKKKVTFKTLVKYQDTRGNKVVPYESKEVLTRMIFVYLRVILFLI